MLGRIPSAGAPMVRAFSFDRTTGIADEVVVEGVVSGSSPAIPTGYTIRPVQRFGDLGRDLVRRQRRTVSGGPCFTWRTELSLFHQGRERVSRGRRHRRGLPVVDGVLGDGLRGSARAHVPVCEDPADVAEPSGIEGDDGAGPRHVYLAGLEAEDVVVDRV